MRLTNQYDLPPQLVRAVLNPAIIYSRGDADMSVTQLLRSPRIVGLTERHRNEMEEDISDRIYSLLGTVLHKVIELSDHNGTDNDAERMVEERIFTKVGRWTISGGIDHYAPDPDKPDSVILADWKFTSVATVSNGREEWEQQLNLYAALLRRERNLNITGVENIVIYRDWSKVRTSRHESYPRAGVERVRQRLWSPKEAEEFLLRRVKLHQDAQAEAELTESFPLCTDADRWKPSDTYAARYVSGTVAKRENSLDALEQWIFKKQSKRKTPLNFTIEREELLPVRCAHYCSAAPFCDQWAAERSRLAQLLPVSVGLDVQAAIAPDAASGEDEDEAPDPDQAQDKAPKRQKNTANKDPFDE